MKKFFLYGAVVIIVVITAFGVFAPKNITVQRSVIIEKPVENVYRFFSFLQNMNLYSPWQTKDPNTVHKYTGLGNTVGSIHRWESEHKEVGVGEQEIKKMIPHQEIVSELRFEKPFESTSQGFFKFKEVDNGTKVIWGYNDEFGFMESIIMMFIDMEKVLGPNFEEGLNKAKSILEE